MSVPNQGTIETLGLGWEHKQMRLPENVSGVRSLLQDFINMHGTPTLIVAPIAWKLVIDEWFYDRTHTTQLVFIPAKALNGQMYVENAMDGMLVPVSSLDFPDWPK